LYLFAEQLFCSLPFFVSFSSQRLPAAKEAALLRYFLHGVKGKGLLNNVMDKTHDDEI
jgi:hypothetical protein